MGNQFSDQPQQQHPQRRHTDIHRRAPLQPVPNVGYPGQIGNRSRSPSLPGAGQMQPSGPTIHPRPFGPSDMAEPGAFLVPGPQREAPAAVRAQVRIPPGVRPGQHFPVLLENQQVMVRCPDMAQTNDLIVVDFQASTFIVTVPEGIRPGQSFHVIVRGFRQRVICPEGVRPGQQIRFSMPDPTEQNSTTHQRPPEPTPFERLYEVNVPKGVRPGEPFVLMADGQRVTVTCPLDAQPEQKIRFKLPITPTTEQLMAYQLNYNKEGWVRSLGVDLRFHWARVESRTSSEARGTGSSTLAGGPQRFSVLNTAFVKAFIGPEKQLTLLPPSEVAIATTVEGTRINFHTLSRGAQLPFDKKVDFFRQHCNSLRIPWEKGHVEVRVRRSHLLVDSLLAFEQIGPTNLRKIFRYQFIGEPAIDAGGVAREFFELASDAIFHPDFGLFQYSGVDQMCVQINPASAFVEKHHLRYFRFVGRLLGKALFDGQLVRHHLVRPIMKHILGWPIVLADMEYLDAETYNSLAQLPNFTGNLEDLCVDFTINENYLGTTPTIYLLPDGDKIPLTRDNVDLYLELQLKYRLCGRFRDQLREILLGFLECIPEALLSVFDFQELELLLCGIPNIDIDDWIRQTDYSGEYLKLGQRHPVIHWFWEVIRHDFDQEQRARLLQFATGTSGVPAQGFAFLQGNDGNIRKFTVSSTSLEQSVFPRAHTCFNRIDLPVYRSKKELRERLSLAIQLESSGFSIE